MEETRLTTQEPFEVLPEGFELVDQGEVTMPRIKVLQAMSPELDDPDFNFKKGDIIHNLLMEKVSDTFIPLLIWSSKVLFAPRDNAKRLELFARLGLSDDGSTVMICRAKDGKVPDMSLIYRHDCATCPLAVWDGNTPPVCTSTVNVLALMDGQRLPAVIQFANTNWKYGKKFRDLALYTGVTLYSRKYKLTVKQEKNDKGSFYTTPVKPAGLPTEDELKAAHSLYVRFKGVNINVTDDANDEPMDGEA